VSPAGEAPFGPRATALLVAAAGVSLAVAVVLAMLGGGLEDVPSAGADSFSRSAIGHRAFLDVLRRLEVPVVVSRHRSVAKAEGALLVLAEPGSSGPGEAILDEALERPGTTLVVLPKRGGRADARNPRWLGASRLLPPEVPGRLLHQLGLSGEVVRPAAVQGWTTGGLPEPDLDGPQLVRSTDLQPIVSSAEGILVGEQETEAGRLVVLADPDLIASHGLGRGGNALLATALVERLRGPRGVVWDETLHGFEVAPSLFRELLRFPLVAATLQATLAALALVWAGARRFGRPAPPPPPAAGGKDVLVENTAELLRNGGHVAHAVGACWRNAVEAAAAGLHAPPGLSHADAVGWLARAGRARDVGSDPARLEARVRAFGGAPGAEAAALALARDIHQWREELLDGHRRHPRHR
jgi:hypothetical protein